MAIYIDEFLYRGRAPDSPEPPAWHLILAAESTDEFGEKRRAEKQLNMQQAEEAGWGLPEIIAGINSAMLVECESHRAAAAAADARVAALEADLAGRAAEVEAKTAAAAEAEARAAALEARLAALQPET